MRRIAGLCLLLALLCSCGGSGKPEAPSAEGGSPDETPFADEKAVQKVPDEFFTAVDRNPDDPEARRRLAIALHDAKRRYEAVENFEKLVELSPTERHLLDLALAYNSISRIPEAIATYERILELSPEDPIVLHNLGNIEQHRGDNETAIAYYSRAIAARPDYLFAYYHMGSALAKSERFEDAFRAYEQALQIEPTTPEELTASDDSLYQLASLDLRMGAYERAAAFLQEVLAANPGHLKAHHAYGQALMQLGRREEAELQFNEHMRLLAEQEPSGPVSTGE